MTRYIRILCIAALAVLVLSVAAFAQAPTKQDLDTWRRLMARSPRPKPGCFQATHPRTEWREVQCTAAPNRRYAPAPQVGGRGGDFSASVTGVLTSADGSFENVTVKKERDGGSNLYSLQLNSARLAPSPACKKSTNPHCVGWEQFVYSSSEGTGFIEYWLVNYTDSKTSCPQGWKTDPAKPNCWTNSAAVSIGSQPITNLASLSVTGTVGSPFDTATFTVGTQTYSVTGDVILGLGSAWNFAEFGIFGDGDGTQAVFGPDTTIGVNLAVDNGTTNVPACVQKTTTGESNNLNLVPPCCAYGGATPSIYFVMTNGSASSPCLVSSKP